MLNIIIVWHITCQNVNSSGYFMVPVNTVSCEPSKGSRECPPVVELISVEGSVDCSVEDSAAEKDNDENAEHDS